mmetsp:Transcript_25379/g.76216  ORF Transcript_25379/g.76216 Transcript_25379/m.76216 type:complete len:140 (+) Transcript_25379:120-539(+)
MRAATLIVLSSFATSSALLAPQRPHQPRAPRRSAEAAAEPAAAPAEAPAPVAQDKLDEMTLVKQSNALDALASGWAKRKEFREWEESRMTGFSEQAEIINGRTAMFFLVVGLLTEFWTGQSIPDQIFTMLRVGGFIGLD